MGGMESQSKYSPASQPSCVDFQLPTPLLSGTPPGTRGLLFCCGSGGRERGDSTFYFGPSFLSGGLGMSATQGTVVRVQSRAPVLWVSLGGNWLESLPPMVGDSRCIQSAARGHLLRVGGVSPSEVGWGSRKGDDCFKFLSFCPSRGWASVWLVTLRRGKLAVSGPS